MEAHCVADTTDIRITTPQDTHGAFDINFLFSQYMPVGQHLVKQYNNYKICQCIQKL